MYIVYILTSLLDSSKYYIGITENLEGRIKEHNSGKKGYSKQYAPWQIETYITFRDKILAQEFERYLKVGSGHAFLKKRFLPNLKPSAINHEDKLTPT